MLTTVTTTPARTSTAGQSLTAPLKTTGLLAITKFINCIAVGTPSNSLHGSI